MSEYSMNENIVTARVATVQTKCTGFFGHHLTARPGDFIVTFPFDHGGDYTGHSMEIPIPAETFYANFTEIKPKKAKK